MNKKSIKVDISKEKIHTKNLRFDQGNKFYNIYEIL